MQDNVAETFNKYRGHLFSIAYRMLGSATDAEDVVQDAFVRWLGVNEVEVESARGYLSTVVVRLCIDRLRAAKSRREVYVGSWLPEPIATGERGVELEKSAIMAESLSYAFMVMMESLGPLERAIFLLREVFRYEYSEIAQMVGKSEANCRQILHRAQQRLSERNARFDVRREEQERLTRQFVRATTTGDMNGLLSLLTNDIVYVGDGGGKVQTALKPVRGRDKVARGTVGGLRLLPQGVDARIEEVNGQPAVVGYIDGKPYGVLLLDVEGGQIRAIYAVLNPDKLRWLERQQNSGRS